MKVFCVLNRETTYFFLIHTKIAMNINYEDLRFWIKVIQISEGPLYYGIRTYLIMIYAGCNFIA